MTEAFEAIVRIQSLLSCRGGSAERRWPAQAVKKLTKIEVLLTVVFLLTGIVIFKTAFWLKSMPESDPVRQMWKPRLDALADPILIVTFSIWAAFTVFYSILLFIHLSAWLFRKLTAEE